MPEYNKNQQYLKQDVSGTVYIRTDALAKRKDMRPFDPFSKGGEVDIPRLGTKTVPIELQGKTFDVEPDLFELLTELSGVLVTMQEENTTLTEAKSKWEAREERLTTDIADLEEQLAAALNPPDPGQQEPRAENPEVKEPPAKKPASRRARTRKASK